MDPIRTSSDTPLPVQETDLTELQYYQNNDAVGLTLMRSVGVVCLIYGTFDIALNMAIWLVPQLRITGWTGSDLAVSFISAGIVIVLSILLIIGGAQMLRQPIGGRGCLLFYAYMKLAYCAWYIGYMFWTIQSRYPASMPRSYVYRAILQYVAIGISSSTLAMILSISLSRQLVRRLFHSSAAR